MYSLAVLSVLAGLTSAQFDYAYPPIACGVGSYSPPCPADSFCAPEVPNCEGCPGLCAFRNTYQNCGGDTMEPNLCYSKDDLCVDDPRKPESCGMACDAPGICVDPNLKTCQCDQDCPDGLWCYTWKKGCTGKNCKKVCL